MAQFSWHCLKYFSMDRFVSRENEILFDKKLGRRMVKIQIRKHLKLAFCKWINVKPYHKLYVKFDLIWLHVMVRWHFYLWFCTVFRRVSMKKIVLSYEHDSFKSSHSHIDYKIDMRGFPIDRGKKHKTIKNRHNLWRLNKWHRKHFNIVFMFEIFQYW